MMTRRMRVRFQLLERPRAPKVIAQRVPTKRERPIKASYIGSEESIRSKKASQAMSEESK